MNVLRKAKKAFLFVSFGLVFIALPASAATLKFGENYTLSASERVSGNLYASGGTIIISGPISGDAALAGASLTISGPISGDALFGAGFADVLGNIAGNLRAAGGKLTVSKDVGGDVALAGGTISIVSGSRVGGDVIVAGGTISLLGEVAGSAYLAGGNIFIDGKIVGNVKVYTAGKVHIGPNAVIGGDFSYRSPEKAVIDAGAVIKGETNFEYLTPILTASDARGFFAGLFGLAFIIRLLILLSAALLLTFTFRRMSAELARLSVAHFWKAALIGFIILIVAPAASFIIGLTVFGLLISALTMLAWLSLLIVAQPYAGVIFASVIVKYLMHRELQPVVSWKAATLGTFGLGVICLVPYAGLFVYLIFVLSALGALSQLAYKHFIVAR